MSAEKKDFIRLRQVCLAVPDLAEAERELCAFLDAGVCHRDERVQRYGLENAVLCLGSTFVELVAPTRPDTAAGRFLDRHPAPLRGAYMAIFDCSDLDAWRGRAESLGMRIANERSYERYRNIQLHPCDTGATMVEIHQNLSGEDLLGHYEPAGMNWQRHIGASPASIGGLEISSPQHDSVCRRWEALLGRPATSHATAFRIELELGTLSFVSDIAERVRTVQLQVNDPRSWLRRAENELGHGVRDGVVTVAGINWRT